MAIQLKVYTKPLELSLWNSGMKSELKSLKWRGGDVGKWNLKR